MGASHTKFGHSQLDTFLTNMAIRVDFWLETVIIRKGFQYSEWKFKMVFAMKGRGGLECHIPLLKNDFFENHL